MKIEAFDRLTYVDEAETVIRKMKEERIRLTTTKIRDLLTMLSGMYTEVSHSRESQLDESMLEQVLYLKMHFAYEAGRDEGVRELVTRAHLLEHLELIAKAHTWNDSHGTINDKEEFLMFCRYMESLVAYHKYYGGE